MSPDEFAFTLTIPADQRFVAVLRDVTLHMANYAQLPQAEGWALADRVVAQAEACVKGHNECRLRFERAGGHLTVALAGEVVARHP